MTAPKKPATNPTARARAAKAAEPDVKKPAARARAAKAATPAEGETKKPATRSRAAKAVAPVEAAPKAAPRTRTPRTTSAVPVAPEGLTAKGRALWRGVLEKFDMRADELTVLEQACRALGRVHDLTTELAGMDVMIAGSTGQMVVNPLLAELRAHEAHVAAMLARLKLKEVDASTGAAQASGTRSTSARDKANARWAVPHAHGTSA